MHVRSPWGFLWLTLGAAMLYSVAYAAVHHEVYFWARRKGFTTVDLQAEPGLFWFVVAFCVFGGIVSTWFGIRVLRGTE